MAIIDDLLTLRKDQPQTNNDSPAWIKELITSRYQPKTERLKRNPVGFEFKRDPFDPSSYYKQLGSFKDISRLATNVTKIETENRERAAYEARQRELAGAVNGVNPKFTYGGGNGGGGVTPRNGSSRRYGLKGVTSNTGKAADYFGSRYGIRSIGGWREHGSVPGSDHPKGRALDFMINNIKNGKATGDALANDLIKNAKSWNVSYVIWNRYIWFPGQGWSKYSGPSPHTDHVHASFKK